MNTDNKTTIRALNDQFRRYRTGQGSTVITNGIQAEGDLFVARALTAVSGFADFNPDIDPHHEHDFGAIEIEGEKIFWKIDYYDLSLSLHSPNPADATVTHRVLTIMLASEY